MVSRDRHHDNRGQSILMQEDVVASISHHTHTLSL
jgi:hypothetical protein